MVRAVRVMQSILALVCSAGCTDLSSDVPPVPPEGYQSDDDFATDVDAGAPSTDPPAGSPSGGGDSGSTARADVWLARNDSFDGYFADRAGQALYMFANDVAGSKKSACNGDCAVMWPPFDDSRLTVSDDLDKANFTRFHRDDGTWQIAYKGHPLYRYEPDEPDTVTGDAVGGRWFVARDYIAFLAVKAQILPEGTGEVVENTPFLTNAAGRSAYVLKTDKPGVGSTDPNSTCDVTCLETWPLWKSPESLDGAVLPSVFDNADFSWFTRDGVDGATNQLMYRGWPLYFYASDDIPGEVGGHLVGDWRVIDPGTFAADPAAAPGNDNNGY